MEKRILTDSFNLRFGVTMHGILFTNSFFAFRHFNNELADFRAEMAKLAHSLMYNNDITSPGTPPPRTQKQAKRSASMRAPCSLDGCAHALVRLRTLDNYQGGKDGRQRCVICNKKTVWGCSDCSRAPHDIVPLCIPMAQQARRHHVSPVPWSTL